MQLSQTWKGSSLAYKAIGILVAILLYYFAPIVFLLFIPGLILNIFFELSKSAFEKISFSFFLSLSYWIVGFWFLKYIPLTLTGFADTTLLLTLIFVALLKEKSLHFTKPTSKDLLAIFLSATFLIPLIPLYKQQNTPSGADMATHTYIARVIAENNSFPKNYDPIAPVSSFGSSPTGMPTLIALTSLKSDLEFGKASLFVVILTYFTFSLSTFLFLQRRFSLLTSFLSAFAALWINRDIIQFLFWGGNPNILSLSLLIFAIWYFSYIQKAERFTTLNSLALAIVTFSSFATHHNPLITAIYIFLPIIIIKRRFVSKLISKNLRFIITTFLFFLFLSIPFLLSLKIPSPEIFTWIKGQHHLEIFHTLWTENFTSALYAIPEYFRSKMGYFYLFISMTGMLIALSKKGREKILHFTTLITVSLLIINSEYWILPLSPILFPDRVQTAGVVSFSFFVAFFFEMLLNAIKKTFKKPKNLISKTSIIVVLFFLSLYLFKDLADQIRWTYESSLSFLSVTNEDLAAFSWIEKNTSSSDIFQNNYGDSGIWIPGLAYRKVTTYDSTAYDLQRFREGSNQFIPTYLFMGSKIVYEDAVILSYDKIKSDPKYKEVYNSGLVHIFKVLKQ